MSNLPLNALRVLESIVRNGSFRAAADELCVSQSAVSHQIKSLEQWIGLPLFDRGGSRPQPYPHTSDLAETLTAAFADIEHACRRTRRRADPVTLVVAAIPSFAVQWLIPRLKDFRQRFPDVAIRIIYAIHDQQGDLSDADVAIVYSQDQPELPGMQSHLLLPGLSAPVASPAVSALIGDAGLRDAQSSVVYLHDSSVEGWQTWFERFDGSAFRATTGMTFEDFNLLHTAVLSGQGVALCPLSMIKEDLASGRLVQLSDVTVNENFGYYILQNTALDTSVAEAARSFIHWLFETRNA